MTCDGKPVPSVPDEEFVCLKKTLTQLSKGLITGIPLSVAVSIILLVTILIILRHKDLALVLLYNTTRIKLQWRENDFPSDLL